MPSIKQQVLKPAYAKPVKQVRGAPNAIDLTVAATRRWRARNRRCYAFWPIHTVRLAETAARRYNNVRNRNSGLPTT